MVWKKCLLLRQAVVSDELNDDVPDGDTMEILLDTKCRTQTWVKTGASVPDRDMSVIDLAVMIPLPEKALPKGVTHVRVEGHDMQVLEVVSPDRWTIYHVRRHRV